MTTIEHPRLEEADSSTQTPTQTPLSGSDWFWIVFAGLTGLIGTITAVILLAQPHKHHVGKKALISNLIGYVVGAVLVFIAILSLVLVGRSASVGMATAPGGVNPSQPSSQQPSATPNGGPQGTSLSLPAESESDSPATVVTYMETEIYIRAYQTGNPAYLQHYYSTGNTVGYSGDAARLSKGGESVTDTVGKIQIDSSSFGQFTATYTVQSPGFPSRQKQVTFVWDSSTNEWGAQSVAFPS